MRTIDPFHHTRPSAARLSRTVARGRAWWCLVFWLLSTLAYAADAPVEYMTRVWRREDGLPNDSITSVLQTSDGYLWAGTMGGLARFDGVRFATIWPRLPNVSDRRITGLCEDNHGNLWAGTDGHGVLRFNASGQTNFTAAQGLANNYVTAIFRQTNGDVWFGTQEGLTRWHDGAFSTLTVREGLPHNRVTGLHSGPSGTLWISTQTGLCQWQNGVLSPCLLGMETASRGMGYFGVYEDRDENLWTFGDTFLLNLSRGKRFNYFHSSAASLSRVWTLFETRQGDMLVGTDSRGLIRVRDGKFTPVNLTGASVIQEIKAIAEDREGNLWIGTRGNGLCRLKRTRLANYPLPEGYTNSRVSAVAENPAGGLWIASLGAGLLKRASFKMEPVPLEVQQLPIQQVNTLLNEQSNLWLATWGQGLAQLDRQGLRATYTMANGLPDLVLTALAPDGVGGLYIGTAEGAICQLQNGRVTCLPYLTLNRSITALLRSPDGTLWHGSEGGGMGCYLTNGTHLTWTLKDGLPSLRVRALRQDAAGRLWIGTDQPGLVCLVRDTLRVYGPEQGLPEFGVNQILDDQQGNLWLGTSGGICRLLQSELAALVEGRQTSINAVLFDRDDGFGSLECAAGHSPSACRTSDGRLWFPAAKGLVMVDPAATPFNPVVPPVVIEGLAVDGDTLFEAPLYAPTRPYEATPRPCLIRASKQTLEFQFTGLSLVSPEKVRFRYQLGGVDHQWVETAGSRKVRYPKLPAGDYQFQVTACNNDGVWNSQPATIAFTVLPPFWQTWWFICLAAGGGSSLIAGGARYWMFRRLRRRLRLLEQQNYLEKERSRIARDMHDAIGARLTQINFLCSLVKRDSGNPAEASKDIDRMAVAARGAIKGLEEIVWTVNPKNDTLDNLAIYLTRQAQEFSQDAGLECQLDIPTDLPAMNLSAEARHNLFLSFKEALNNVAKHAHATSVWVGISIADGRLSVSIKDNGRGFEPQREATGNGLLNMKERLRSLGGFCRIESRPAAGTTITLELPFL